MIDWIGVKFLFLLGVIMLWYPYRLWRNKFVFDYRNKVLFDPYRTPQERLERMNRLPHYNVMLRQYLRFNWDDYLND